MIGLLPTARGVVDLREVLRDVSYLAINDQALFPADAIRDAPVRIENDCPNAVCERLSDEHEPKKTLAGSCGSIDDAVPRQDIQRKVDTLLCHPIVDD